MNRVELPQPDSTQFTKDVFGEDDLGAVVRVHIRFEYQLNEFIRKSLRVPHHIEKSGLEFVQKVDLALALGLEEDLCTPLKAMGTLRNRFAHQIGTSLDKTSIKNLYSTLSTSNKELVQNAFINLKGSDDRLKHFANISSLGLRAQFALIATVLWARLEVEKIHGPSSNEA